MFERIPRKRVAMITGWAVDAMPLPYQVDAAFPLSDHADYEDLIRYVELVQAPASTYAARLWLPRLPATCARVRRSLGIERREPNGIAPAFCE